MQIRNIAIIAHVDHGKTTLVDGLLKQANTFRDNQSEMSQVLLMDSGDQERERGITITAKVTSVEWGDVRINIIDTPGHADFSGEVERTLNMADGCILVVDAQEGPMPQTRFVLEKALKNGLKPIVIINKIDKPASRLSEVEDEIADLFLELADHEDQLHYPIIYAIARNGKAWDKIPQNPEEDGDLKIVFDTIIDKIPAPTIMDRPQFSMLVTALGYDTFKGKYSIGRIQSGSIKIGMPVKLFKDGNPAGQSKVDGLYHSIGLTRFEVKEAEAGDIVQITGIKDSNIGDTIGSLDLPEALPTIEVEKPTLKIYLGPNTSPFKGREGEYNTTRQIGDRLRRELESNVALKVEETDLGFLVSGRGELHLSVLIETMRREGYEFEVGRPEVILQEENGVVTEPVEELVVEVSGDYAGNVQMELGSRKAELLEQKFNSSGNTKLKYTIPSRNLLGARNTLLTLTKGTIIMGSTLLGYRPIGEKLKTSRNGALVAYDGGTSTPYSLQAVEPRGVLLVGPGQEIYAGMVIGIYNKQGDLEVNITKEKALTNMRTHSSDGVVQLTPYTKFSLEQCIDFIEDDELLEVTPKTLRIRKKILDHNMRKRSQKN